MGLSFSDGTSIECVPSVRLVGVIVSQDLKWFQNTKYICIVDQDSEVVKQESPMVLTIMKKMIQHYKTSNNDITSLAVKLDNASNFKNEMVVSFLQSTRFPGEEHGQDLRIYNHMNNEAGDGKDAADPTGSHAKAKVNREVDSLACDADNPRNFANAIVRGIGLVNTVVMLGPIIGNQAILDILKDR